MLAGGLPLWETARMETALDPYGVAFGWGLIVLAALACFFGLPALLSLLVREMAKASHERQQARERIEEELDEELRQEMLRFVGQEAAGPVGPAGEDQAAVTSRLR